MRTVAVVFVLAFASGLAAQASPQASSSPAFLNPAILNKVLDLIATAGVDHDLSATFGNALGLSGTGQTWPYRGIATKVDGTHGVAINRGSTPDLVFTNISATTLSFYRAQRNGQVVSAGFFDKSTKKLTMRTPTEAQADLNAELGYWTKNIDYVTEWTYCSGQIAGGHRVPREKKIANCTALIQSGTRTPADLALAYIERSEAYEWKDDGPQKKLADLNAAVKADPNSAHAWAQMCSVENGLKDMQQAMQYCTKAITIDPKWSEGWTFRGDIHLKLAQYDDAIADYNHAIELDPKWMWPWDNRGEAYLRKDQIDRAIQDFNKVIELNPDYAMGFLDRGIARMLQNDAAAALADFEAGIKVDSECGSCYVGRGLAKRRMGNVADGDADVAKGKAMNPHATDNFAKDGIAVP
jgi:tetratricopeptide (TPR) repeat protein